MTFDQINSVLRQFVVEHNSRGARNFCEEHQSEIQALPKEQQIQILEKRLILEFKAQDFWVCHKIIDRINAMALSAPIQYRLAIQLWEANIALEEGDTQYALACLKNLRMTIHEKRINNPLFLQNVENLGIRIYIKTKRYKRIRKAYRKLLADPTLLPESKEKLLLNIGIMYYLRQQYSRATAFFLKVITDNSVPVFVGYSFMYLGRIYPAELKKHYYEKAYCCFRIVGSQKYMQIISAEYKDAFGKSIAELTT